MRLKTVVIPALEAPLTTLLNWLVRGGVVQSKESVLLKVEFWLLTLAPKIKSSYCTENAE